jgi:hypothetical protein
MGNISILTISNILAMGGEKKKGHFDLNPMSILFDIPSYVSILHRMFHKKEVPAETSTNAYQYLK